MPPLKLGDNASDEEPEDDDDDYSPSGSPDDSSTGSKVNDGECGVRKSQFK